jgi:hypothetical protein
MAGHVQLIEKPRNNRKKPFVITPRYEEIIHAILLHRGLTAEQVRKLFYGRSLSFVQTIMLELVEQKYLCRTLFPHVKPGTSSYVYSLGTRAIPYLISRDLYIEGFKPVKSGNYYTLLHLLQLNDFAISARLLPRVSSDVVLTSWLHEWQLKQRPVSAEVNNTQVSSVPDLWFDFTVRAGSQKKPCQMPVWVEIDMGTEWGQKFKNKLCDIVLLVTDLAHEKRFGVQNITVAFATSGTAKRRDLMRQHMKAVLQELDRLNYADVFLCASLKQELEPEQVFLSPIWYTPINDTPLSLLDLSD